MWSPDCEINSIAMTTVRNSMSVSSGSWLCYFVTMSRMVENRVFTYNSFISCIAVIITFCFYFYFQHLIRETKLKLKFIIIEPQLWNNNFIIFLLYFRCRHFIVVKLCGSRTIAWITAWWRATITTGSISFTAKTNIAWMVEGKSIRTSLYTVGFFT